MTSDLRNSKGEQNSEVKPVLNIFEDTGFLIFRRLNGHLGTRYLFLYKLHV